MGCQQVGQTLNQHQEGSLRLLCPARSFSGVSWWSVAPLFVEGQPEGGDRRRGMRESKEEKWRREGREG